jgi:hypothetical protein
MEVTMVHLGKIPLTEVQVGINLKMNFCSVILSQALNRPLKCLVVVFCCGISVYYSISFISYAT